MADENLELQSKSEIQSVDQIVDNLTLFDDDLMSMVFDGNVKATELLLKIILKRDDIHVLTVVGQRELKNPTVYGRNIRLDIFAQDCTGRYIDIEVQRSDEGAHVRRARFHSSTMDTRMLKQKQKFKELLDSYVIFITENDIIGAGLPLYHIKRVIEETNESFDDGSHIIYVNGSYNGEDSIGKLMHDFRCKKSTEMFYGQLSDGVKHFKETKGGRKVMCKAVEEYADMRAAAAKAEAKAAKAEAKAAKAEAKAAAEEQQIKLIRNLMDTMKITLEQAMNALKISEADRVVLMKKF
jgi:predicted transposase/invertase (TIGR01784 family)